MRTLVSLLPALACVGMMLFMCLPMMRGRRRNSKTLEEASIREEVAALRIEVARLRQENQALERNDNLDSTEDAFP